MGLSSTVEVDSPNVELEISDEKGTSFWRSRFGEALKDYIDGLMQWRMWSYMAYADIRRRYRRTLIGPFWTTLSLAIFIGSFGLLFSLLWHTNVKTFLPYFASGYICWMFFSAMISEGCQTFIGAEGLLKQVVLPYGIFAWLVVARNFLIFLHQIVIYIVIMIVFHVKINAHTLLIIPGFLLLILSGSWIAMLLGLLCARYRDVQQVVASLLQISMFVTPIFWPEKQLGHGTRAYFLVNGNPLYHYVAIVRQPLLGHEPKMLSWIIVSIITICGWLLTLYIMSRKQRKLIFWLL